MIEKEYYDYLSSKIKWVGSVPIWENPVCRSVKSGQIAGTVDARGYRVIGIKIKGERRSIKASRLCYYMHYGVLPKYIDHIDKNKANDDINNLRSVTHKQNMLNQGARKGSSIYKGVSWTAKLNKWKSYIKINGKDTHLGYFTDEIEASKAYDQAVYDYGLQEYAVFNFPQK